MTEEKKKIYRVAQEVSKETHENLEALAEKLKLRKSFIVEAILMTITESEVMEYVAKARPKMIKHTGKIPRSQIMAQLREMTTEDLAKLLEKTEGGAN